MPDINFLPPEEQPKRRAIKKEGSPLEFFQPSSDSRSQAVPLNMQKPKRKMGESLNLFFRKFKKSDKSELAEPVFTDQIPGSRNSRFFDIQKTRESLLKEIKGSKEEVKEKVNSNNLAAQKVKEIKEERKETAIMAEKPKPNLVSDAISLPKERKFWLKPWFSWLKNWWQLRKEKAQSAKAAKVKPLVTPKVPNGEKITVAAKTQLSAAPVFQPREEPPKEQSSSPQEKREDILETNLIKGQELTFFDWHKAIKINIFSVAISLIIIGTVWGYLFWLAKQATPVSAVDRQLATKEQALKQLEGEIGKLGSLRAKVAEVKKILDQHIYWTNFFSFLENNTLSGVSYDGFEGDISGKYILPAATSDFKTFSAQMKTWQEEKNYVISATAPKVEAKKSGSSGQEVLSFEINLAVKPDIFKQP